jgi:exosome complex exonuclease RRP6
VQHCKFKQFTCYTKKKSITRHLISLPFPFQSLYRWRDGIARAEDESTGYILPNKTLLEIGLLLISTYLVVLLCLPWLITLPLIFGSIAKEMPVTSGKLKRIVKSRNLFLERHLSHVINNIRDAIAASGAFESVAEQLKKGKLEEVCYLILI